MKNLKAYPKGRFAFHELCIRRLKRPALQARLNAIKPQVNASFDIYDVHFKANSIESITVDPYFDPHKLDLEELYVYKSFAIRQFKKEIEDQQPNSIKYTCQSCGIDSVSSMDHFLPQALYPQYSVNPYNLVPSCGKCNGRKNVIWIKNGRRVFLNPYLDKLPSVEFLFVDVSIDTNNDLDFQFRIANINGIDVNLYSLIEDHFDKLELLKRMREASIRHLSEFQNLVKHSLKTTSIANLRVTITGKCSDDRIAYGVNYWKSVLELALINSNDFLTTLPP